MRRAVFLALHIKPGFPGERLTELKLKSARFSIAEGFEHSSSFILCEKPMTVYLDFCLQNSNGQVSHPVNIRALEVPFEGGTYDYLNFDEHARLKSFSRQVLLKGGGELRIQVNDLNGKLNCSLIRISANGMIGPQEPLQCNP